MSGRRRGWGCLESGQACGLHEVEAESTKCSSEGDYSDVYWYLKRLWLLTSTPPDLALNAVCLRVC